MDMKNDDYTTVSIPAFTYHAKELVFWVPGDVGRFVDGIMSVTNMDARSDCGFIARVVLVQFEQGVLVDVFTTRVGYGLDRHGWRCPPPEDHTFPDFRHHQSEARWVPIYMKLYETRPVNY